MCGNRVLSQAFAKVMRHALCEAARIDKNEGRTMLRGQLDKAIVDFVPHFVGSHRAKLATGNLDRNIELAPMAYLHNDRIGPIRTSQKMRHEFDGLLGSGKANAREALAG
jgi:hypothetical protein